MSILVKNNLQHEVFQSFVSSKGNYITLQCKIETNVFVLGSINGPNKDNPHFYECIDKLLDSVDYDRVVLG